jgi:hypothetical protein
MMKSKMMAGGGMMKKGYAAGGAMPMGADGKPTFASDGVWQNGCWWRHDVQDEGRWGH